MRNNNLTDPCNGCWLSGYVSMGFCQQNKRPYAKAHITHFAKGENLIKSGMPALGVYCIRNGKVKAYLKDRNGDQFDLLVLGHSELIGLSSISNNDMYNCSAIAIEDVMVCFIKMSDLIGIVVAIPKVREKIMKDLSSRLKFMEHRIVSLSKNNVKDQVAEILMHEIQADKFVKQYNTHFSLTDLARLIGADKKYLYKIMSELTSKEIVSLQNHKVVINDVNALAKMANGKDSTLHLDAP